MKRTVLLSLFALAFFLQVQPLPAQTPAPLKIGVVNSAELLEAMPERQMAVDSLRVINEQYKAELTGMQAEYNGKYATFVTNQRKYTDKIRLRQMAELTDLEKKIDDFTRVAQQDVEFQEQKLLRPLQEKVHRAIARIGEENGFTVIYDLAAPSVAFVTPSAVDINDLVRKKLKTE